MNDNAEKMPDGLPSSVVTEVIRLLAEVYTKHIFAAPVPDGMKLGALSLTLAAVVKSLDLHKGGFKTAEGESITTPEALLDHICNAAKDLLSHVQVMSTPKLDVESINFTVPNNGSIN